jgi:triphosphoribosyl-dephospho-CoA synthetase
VTQAWSVVAASVVTGSFGLLIAYVNRFRKENREDHMTVMDMLRHVNRSVLKVEDKIDLLDDRLDTHILKDHKKKK